MVSLLAQLGQLMCDPRFMLVALHTSRAIERLSPESKEKIAHIVRWGVARASQYALESVLGDVGSSVIDQVINDRDVADGAKELVKRGLAIGVEKALREARISG